MPSGIKMTFRDKNDTIAAISTPAGEGGIAIVRLSGPDSIGVADKIFRGKSRLSKCKSHTISYGYIIDDQTIMRDEGRRMKDDRSVTTNGRRVDEVLVTVMRAPRTFTREDTVEINCHGGARAARSVLELLLKNGVRLAEPGEFTKTAFLNGRIDLAQAEAVLDIIRAKTDKSLSCAIDQLNGSLSFEITKLTDEITAMLAQLETSIDFPDEDVEIMSSARISERLAAIEGRLDSLYRSSDHGIILRDGLLLTICGRPNTGKSSLMNLLLRRDRVIVSDIAGTTRDAIEELININGIPLRIADTAGITRRSSGNIEAEGIKRSRDYLRRSDVVIVMIDSSREMNSEDKEILAITAEKKRIIVINKIDLAKKKKVARLKKYFSQERFVAISVEKRENIKSLEEMIVDLSWGSGSHGDEASAITNCRQKELIKKALGSITKARDAAKRGLSPEVISLDAREALYALGLIIGRSVSPDILKEIFSQFCIGK